VAVGVAVEVTVGEGVGLGVGPLVPAARYKEFFPSPVKPMDPILLPTKLTPATWISSLTCWKPKAKIASEVKLPAGFTMDEMPQPFKTTTDFGNYSVTYRQENGTLYMDEEFRTEAVTLPPADYGQVKKFFDSFTGADRQQAVLVRSALQQFNTAFERKNPREL